MHDIPVSLSHRHGFQLGGIQPGRRLGHSETSFLITGDQGGQHARALFIGSELDHRVEPENVHVDGRCPAGASPRFGNRLHHDGRFGDPQTGTADVFRHGNTKPATICHRPVQIMREARSDPGPASSRHRTAHISAGSDLEFPFVHPSFEMSLCFAPIHTYKPCLTQGSDPVIVISKIAQNASAVRARRPP